MTLLVTPLWLGLVSLLVTHALGVPLALLPPLLWLRWTPVRLRTLLGLPRPFLTSNLLMTATALLATLLLLALPIVRVLTLVLFSLLISLVLVLILDVCHDHEWVDNSVRYPMPTCW